jgi:hypothetical protein
VVRFAGYPQHTHQAVGGARALGLVVLGAVLLGLWLRARRMDTAREVVAVTGLALAVSVVLAPVTFPWYAIAPLAVLGYGLARDRVRWWVGAATVPLALLILPSGSGLASRYKTPGGILDVLLVVAAVVAGLAWARRPVRIAGTREAE